jgi:hypothetical protein
MHLSCVKVSTICEWTELSFEPRRQWVTSSASETIYEPMAHFAQTVHLFALKLTLSPNKKKRDSTWPTSPRVPLGASKWFLSQSYVRHKCFTYLASWLALSPNGSSYHLSLVTSEYHRVHPKMISEPMVCLVQTVHLSCCDPNTVSKWKEVTFQMTHIT